MTSPTPTGSSAQTPVHVLDKHENLLLKKYARYSKSSPKSGSAVVRIPTFNFSVKASHINRQTSLGNMIANKINSYKISTNLLNGTHTLANDGNISLSKQISKNSIEQQQNLSSDNASSKMSLFKKSVISLEKKMFLNKR